MSNIITIGDATLYLGDCREILPTLGKVDAVVTDPPYGNGTEYGLCEDTNENLEALITKVMPLLLQKAIRVLITCGVANLARYPKSEWVLNWTDPSGEGGCPWGFPSWQPILAYGKDPYLQRGLGRRSDTIVKRFLRGDYNLDHPCPKPLGLMKWLIDRSTFINETILDPFMGSGTTGVACVRLGRKFIGIEIEPKYFDIACRRIEEATRQPDMFIEKPAPAKQLEFAAVTPRNQPSS